MSTKKWRDDPDFVAWLKHESYATLVTAGTRPFLTEATLFYMWEAFRAGREVRTDEAREQAVENGRRR